MKFRNLVAFILIALLVSLLLPHGISIAKPNIPPEFKNNRVEIISKRTRYSKTFLNPDGTKTYEAYLTPIHFKNEKGEWEDIDDTVVFSKDRNFFENKANSFKVKIPREILDEDLSFSFTLKEINLNITLVGINKDAEVSVKNNTILLKDLWNGVDLLYTITNTGLKDYFIIKSPDSQMSFKMIYKLEGKGAIKKLDNNDIEIVNNSEKITILRPFSFDSSKEKNYIEPTINIALNGDEIEYSVSIDKAKLDESIKFPLIIDPYIEGMEIHSGQNSDTAKDSYVYYKHGWEYNYIIRRWVETYEGLNENTNSDVRKGKHLKVGKYYKETQFPPGKIVEGESRTFIYFPLPDDLSGKFVSSAYIKFRHVDGDSPKIKVCEPLSDWDENTITWNNQPQLGFSTESSYFVENNEDLNRVVFVTPILQRVAWNQTTYYGFAITVADDVVDGPEITVGSREYEEGGGFYPGGGIIQPTPYPPSLVINYSENYGASKPFQLKKFKIDSHTSFFINMSNGNLVLQSEDFSIPARGGLPILLTRTYNSLDEGNTPFGYGWTSNIDQILKGTNLPQRVATYTYITSTGRLIKFRPLITSYDPKPTYTYGPGEFSNMRLEFTEDQYTGEITEYKVSTPSGLYIKFDQDGYPTEFGNKKASLSFVRSGTTVTGISEDGTNPRTLTVQYTNGYRTRATDPLGRYYTYTYDSNGNLVSVTDPEGNTTHYSYDSNHLLTSITDARGNTTQFVYNDHRQVVGVIDALGNTWSFSYDSGNSSNTMTDPLGNTWTYIFNPDGTLHQRIDPDGNTVTYEYDDRLRITSITDANGNITTYEYDEDNERITTIVDALGNSSVFEYDSNSNLISYTDKKGRVTTYTYSTDGIDLLSIHDPLGRTTSFSYDENHNLISRTLPNGATFNYTYDANGDYLTSVTDPEGNTTHYSYDGVGNMISMTDPEGNTTTFTYDSMNRLVSKTDPFGNTWHFSYDENGNLVSVTDPLGHTKTIVYDALNRKIQEIDPLGKTTTFTYDARGKLISITDPNNHTYTMNYTSSGRLLTLTDPQGGTINYTYDNNGNITSVSDCTGSSKSLSYDPLNRNTSYTDSDGTTMHYSYDEVGNLTEETKPDGTTITLSYDNGDRLVTKSYPDGQTVNYTYDSMDNPTNISFNLGTYTLSFDQLNRLTSMTDPFGLSTSFSYTPRSSILQEVTPFTTTSFTYDEKNRLTDITLESGKEISYSYDEVDRLSVISYPNSIVTDLTFDDDSRITRELIFRNPDNPETIFDFGFIYDNKGNIVSISLNGDTTGFTYDEKDQLIRVDYPDGTYKTYSYDCKGNLLQESDGTETINYTYSGYKLTSLSNNGSNTTFSYDTNGNLVSISSPDGTRTLTWDFDDRLVSVTLEDGTIINYFYDPLGRIIKREKNGEIELFHYLGRSNLLYSITDENNSPIITFQFDSKGNPLSLLYQGNRYYMHFNTHGDLIALSDEIGNIVATWNYSPWGEIIEENNQDDIPVPFLYTGRYGVLYDKDTGMYLMGRRWYSPDIKRFISKDPVLKLTSSFSLNPYQYARNNPVNVIDPSGESAAPPVTTEEEDEITDDVVNKLNDTFGTNYTKEDLDWVIWYEDNDTIEIVGFSAKEGEDVRWNRGAFGNVTSNMMNNGITLHYWYNKEKIKEFKLISRDLAKEKTNSISLTILSIALGLAGLCPPLSILSIFSILLGIPSLLSSLENASLSLSVSAVFTNGNVLTTTAFYGGWLNFLSFFTIYGYRYGSWTIPDIDDWRGHP